MKDNIFILLFICVSLSCSAQQHDYNWVFGVFTYPDEPNANGNIINFAGDTVSIEVYEKDVNIGFYNATYSDSSGKLKFWSNGCELYNPNSEILENGDTLNAGLVYDAFCENQFTGSYISAYQSMICLPDLQDENKVYVFHKWEPWDLINDFHRLYYSVIDFSNNSEGKVLKKNIDLPGDTSSGLISATKDNDFDAWWIITPEKWGTGHYVYKMEADSISEPNYFEDGTVLTSNNQGSSSSSFSPDGSKYAIFGEADGLRLYDFDNATGILSNFQFIAAPQDFEGGTAGLAFSGSGRFMYVSHFRKIYQYDMEASDISASRLTVADWEENFEPVTGFPSPFFQMQRGPDCRIYVSAQNSTKIIHVIHHPERRGVACEVQQNIEIPAFNFGSTPNFPNYRLGTGPVCDSTKVFPPGLITAIDEAVMQQEKELLHVYVYPNPTSGDLFLELDQSLGPKTSFVLYNLQGQEQYRQTIRGDVGTEQISLPELASGMYIYAFMQAGRVVSSDKLVVE